MAAEDLTVVCAWCQRTVTAAPAGARITHTICPSCVDRTQLDDDDTDPAMLNQPADYFGDAFKD